MNEHGVGLGTEAMVEARTSPLRVNFNLEGDHEEEASKVTQRKVHSFLP